MVIEATPHKVNKAACYIGCSSGLKCFEVSTFLSIKVFNEFILSKMTIALHLLNIERFVIREDGNLWSRQDILKYANIEAPDICCYHSPSDGT